MMKNDSDQLLKYYLRAYKQGKALEYEYTFFECRKAGELICFILTKRMSIEVNPREMQMEKLLGVLQGQLPRVIEASLRLIQSLGNYGSHHQHSPERETDKMFIEPCIVATRSLIKYLYPTLELDNLEKEIDQQLAVENPLTDAFSKAHSVHQKTGTTLRAELRRYVESQYGEQDEFRLGDLSRDFHALNPSYSLNSVRTHTHFMTTNYPSRLSHKIKVDGSDDLLYRIDQGVYRRYNPSTDPLPTYPAPKADSDSDT